MSDPLKLKLDFQQSTTKKIHQTHRPIKPTGPPPESQAQQTHGPTRPTGPPDLWAHQTNRAECDISVSKNSWFQNFPIVLIVSVSVSKKFSIEKSIGIGFKNFWYQKKYRYRFQKILVSEKKYRYRFQKILVLKKSIGIGFEKFWSQKKYRYRFRKISY